MTEKRFFILQLEDGDLPCIRDRTFRLDDIYGHYKYDNLEQLCSFLNELNDENEQLKKELGKFKEWEKHCRAVKREELDRVFKMSIYEIAEAFEYYKERIKKLEKELESE